MEKSAPTIIKDWLTAEGRKVNWLADRVGINRATVSQWINGHQVPALGNRRRLQEVTGLPVAHEEAWL
jgi:transcriptional regulator with XRE-family HTH domain